MKKIYCLLNHPLTPLQIYELKSNLLEVTLPPEPVSEIWKMIPPDEERVEPSLNLVTEWLRTASGGDHVLVQGDFGATFYIVNFCFSHSLIPLYSTTIRKAREWRKGDKVFRHYTFEHVRFREYQKYGERN